MDASQPFVLKLVAFFFVSRMATYHDVRKNGKVIGRVPEKPTNRFGRPLFQGLQYSDTPLQPLAKMEFVDPNAGDSQQYQIISVNTMGLMSEN